VRLLIISHFGGQSQQNLFWSKTYSDLPYFNYYRPNSYKDWKAPVEILRELQPEMDPDMLVLPPLDLESFICTQGVTMYHPFPLFLWQGVCGVEVENPRLGPER
jgi:hypothetical protein